MSPAGGALNSIVRRHDALRTYPLVDDSGAMRAFEVSNVLLSAREIAALVSDRLAASVTGGPNTFFSRDDTRLRFEYAGVEFEVVEPFGDNSRYWIGPVDGVFSRVDALAEIEAVFRSYRPSLLRRVVSALGG
jgi:hypothetical protein